MPHQRRLISDPFEFARRHEVLDGELDARDLPRLAGMLRDVGAAQQVRFEITGSYNGDKSFLDVAVTADLTLLCQRCLEELRRTVEVNARLLLVPEGKDLPDEELEEDEFDPIHVGRDFDACAAVEEELLLALPLAPTHEVCSVPAAQENGDDRSPFALLKGLKTGKV